jgi:DNA-binding MarR family transcriptional regulator
MPKKQTHSDSAIEYMQTLRKLMRLSVDWIDTVAGMLDVHPTDLMACSYLHEAGTMTAGELAKAIGLTTGAMTAAIDRLERAGFAKRETDPHDRRKVIVKSAKLPKELLAMREEAMKKIRPVFSRYTDAEISRMVKSMQELADVFEKEIPTFKRSLPINKPINYKK